MGLPIKSLVSSAEAVELSTSVENDMATRSSETMARDGESDRDSGPSAPPVDMSRSPEKLPLRLAFWKNDESFSVIPL